MDILVVDDDTDFVNYMRRFLIIDDHSVTTAYSGEEALEIVQQQDFELILTDLKMGGITGIDLIRELRRRKIYTYVIVITGYGTINSAVDAMKVGAFDYLLKPFDYDDLNEKINEVKSEIQLVSEIMVPKLDESAESKNIELPNLNEFPDPYLVISEVQDFDKILKLENSEAIWLGSSNDSENRIPPAKLYLLKNHIVEFVKKQETGTIIFHGIENILEIHTWAKFKKFIQYLEKEVLKTNFTMIFLIEEIEDEFTQYYDLLLYDALSNLSNKVFSSILDVISHPSRKGIITLLGIREKLPFNKIAKELNVENTSTFTFHVKKLVQESVIKKQDNNYILTSRGQYIAKIIVHFEKIGLADPSARVKAFKIPKIVNKSLGN